MKKSKDIYRSLNLTVEEMVEIEEALTTKIIILKSGDWGPARPEWIEGLVTIRQKVQHVLRRDHVG